MNKLRYPGEFGFARHPIWSESNRDAERQLVFRPLQGGSELARGWPVSPGWIWEMKLK